MPKYHKTTRVELWRTRDDYQDATGSWHKGRPTHVSTLWACIKGQDYRATYENRGVWANPIFEATVTRPKFTLPRIGDHIRHEGRFFEIKQINDLTGQAGHDMTLTCELDEQYHVQ